MVHGLIQSSLGYPGLGIACAGSGIVVPMPEDVPLLYAGTQIAGGSWAWPAVILVGVVGVGLRDLGAWAMGRYLIRWLLATRAGHWLFGNKLRRAERLISNHGSAAVLIGRFLVGFRAPVFMAAGAMGVPLRSFVGYDAVGLVIAVPMTVGLGYVFGAPIIELAAAMLQRASAFATIGALAAGIWFVWRATALAPAPAPEPERIDPT